MTDRPETFDEALRRLMAERKYSIRMLSAAATMSKTKLGGMCQPGAMITDRDAIALDSILQSGLTLVSAARRGRQASMASVLLGRNRYTDLAVSLGGGPVVQEVGAVDRRDFLQAGVLGPTVALELSRLGLADAMTARDAISAAEWEEIVTEHGFAYMTTTPADFLDQLMVDVLAIQLAVDGEREDSPLAHDLQRCAAMLAALMAMTVANLGRLREARRWWRTARNLADRSTDPATRAWIRGQEVVRALYEQRPIELILTMAGTFQAELVNVPHDATAVLQRGRTQALALAGRIGEAKLALSEVTAIGEKAVAQAGSQSTSVFGGTLEKVRFTESFVHSFLGDYAKAAEAQDAALALYPKTFVRGPAQIELQRALCLARTGDSTAAARHALRTLERLPEADRIPPVVDLAYRVDGFIPVSEARLPAVQEFRAYLATQRQIESH